MMSYGSRKVLKIKLLIITTVTLVSFSRTTLVRAQQAAGHSPMTDAELYPQPPSIATMQAYLAANPELVELIKTHPQVVTTPEFLKMQPRIAMFLDDHPE